MDQAGLNGELQAHNPLFELQQTLYNSGNFTRRRLHRERLAWVSEAIREAAAAPLRRGIEYGPGSGIYLPLLAEHCREAVAADIEPAYLEGIASLRGTLPNLQLAVDDIQQSRLEPGSFDLVLCSEVLEHVPDPERALKTIAKLLRPGGTAIVTTPQKWSVMELCCKVAFLPGVIDLVRAIYREPILPTGHISLRSHRAFGKAIAAAGLEVQRHSKLGLYLPLLAEFGGEAGGRWIARLETHLADSVVNGLLWTQAYVLRKPSP